MATAESLSKDLNKIESQLRSLGMATKEEQEEGKGQEPEASEPKIDLTLEQTEELETLITQANSEPDPNKQLELFTQIKNKLTEIKASQTTIETSKELLPPAELERRKRYRVIVKPGLEEAVRDGKYDNKYSDIELVDFPLKPNEAEPHNIEVELLYFDKSMMGEEAIIEIEKLGFRPATIRELLALGSQFPNLQKNFMILALGSISPERLVASIDYEDLNRILQLVFFDYDFGGKGYRFLAVKNEKEENK